MRRECSASVYTLQGNHGASPEKLKRERYNELVKERRACRLCKGLGVHNPSACAKDEFGSTNIGPWTDWQGHLDAKLMIVGQEWDGHLNFLELQGRNRDTCPTNMRLIVLLRTIGVDIPPPSWEHRPPLSQAKLFFTNAALCLREGRASENDSRSKPPPAQCFRNCATSFLRPQIELIQPKVVITLGLVAYRSVVNAFGLKPKKLLRQAVLQIDPIVLNESSLLFPVYHPGAWSRRRNRSMDQQIEDWKRIRLAISL
jgi:uracil-DNA glycosylase family 4